MINLLGILLAIFIGILIYVFYKKTHDIFDPQVIFLLLEFIAYVPGVFIFTSESSVFFTINGYSKVVAFEIIYITFVLIGISFAKKIKWKKAVTNGKIDFPISNILICYMIGFGAKVLVIQQLGGLTFVLDNGQYAYLMQSHGYGIYTMLYKFMLVAILGMCEKCITHKDNKMYKVLLCGMILLYVTSFLIYTSRTPGLIIILIGLFIVNFRIKKINFKRIFSLKILVIIILLFGASYIATSNRTINTSIVRTTIFTDLVYNYTDIGRDIRVYEYFEDNAHWYGYGYLNIPYALIPGIESKPSMDDGIYLVNIIRGYHVDINENSDELPVQTGSVPFSTPGYMYANFNIIGIIIGGIIMGVIIGCAYKFMLQELDAFSIAVYFYIIYSFGLSTGRMIPTLISCAFLIVFKKNLKIKLKFT